MQEDDLESGSRKRKRKRKNPNAGKTDWGKYKSWFHMWKRLPAVDVAWPLDKRMCHVQRIGRDQEYRRWMREHGRPWGMWCPCVADTACVCDPVVVD